MGGHAFDVTSLFCLVLQEVDLLEHAASIPPDQRQQPPRPPPADVMQHLLGAASNLQRQRQHLQSQVFRPTVALPTVSVEQQVCPFAETRLHTFVVGCTSACCHVNLHCDACELGKHLV